MNTLLRCVLLFFILGAGAALYMSYTAVLPSSPEDLQTIEGRVIYVQTNKSRGTSYYKLNLVDGTLKQRRFYLDVYSTEIDGYKAAIYDKEKFGTKGSGVIPTLHGRSLLKTGKLF